MPSLARLHDAYVEPPTCSILALSYSVSCSHLTTFLLSTSYGPFTATVQKPEWNDLSVEEFYRRKAMQGHSYVVADEVRVIRTDSDPSKGYEDVNPDGKEVGEVVVRGNMVMKEYYRDTEATKKAFEGGYFHSGDLAVRDPSGAISIQDRSKDIIISGGSCLAFGVGV